MSAVIRGRSTLGERCRCARRNAGLSIGQAIRLSSVDGIEAIESGSQLPHEAEMAMLAFCYGVSIAWLSDGVATRISDETARVICDADISDSDRGSLLELLSMLPDGEVVSGR